MRFLSSCMLVLLSLTFAEFAWCGSLTVLVNYPGAEKAKLSSAVIYLTPEDPSTAAGYTPRRLEILQQDKQFHPYILLVRVGDTVSFPNMDSVSHHVYSFSPPRTFEIPLYAADSKTPEVVFEKPGVVALGCNIHDWMLAFLLVIDTPWYSEVKDNLAFIDHLPDGKYQMYFWYPSLSQQPQVTTTIELRGNMSTRLDLLDRPQILIQPVRPVHRPGLREDY